MSASASPKAEKGGVGYSVPVQARCVPYSRRHLDACIKAKGRYSSQTQRPLSVDGDACAGKGCKVIHTPLLCDPGGSGSDAAVQPPHPARSRLVSPPFHASQHGSAKATTPCEHDASKRQQEGQLGSTMESTGITLPSCRLWLPESGPLQDVAAPHVAASGLLGGYNPHHPAGGFSRRARPLDLLVPIPRFLWMDRNFLGAKVQASAYGAGKEQRLLPCCKGRWPAIARPYCLPGSVEARVASRRSRFAISLATVDIVLFL